MTTELATRGPELLARLMTAEEARGAANKIRRGIGELRRLLVEFKEREGWKALGYSGLEECCRAEFNIGHSHLFRQLRAADVEKNVGSPLGTEREAHLRPLAGKPPEVQREVWAASEEDGKRDAASVQRAVEKVEGRTETRSNPSQLFSARGEPNATQEPERARGADAGAGPAGAEASVQDAGVEEADEPTLDFASMDERSRVVAPAGDLGEIEAAILKRNGISVGKAAGLFSQILAAAEQGGANWQARLRAACRPGLK